ncbi:Phospholipid-transporting ATPase IB [Thelohanellus kitauei]|uniref:Phospholipid-transporting ATPase n=1 Tax=Thelohanellus kitauei TaxID=669202 RepID=A0A0C2JGG1_THEKT|nr:Phospholipid-transporting ATPase IB [Thelohanellus kitauei]
MVSTAICELSYHRSLPHHWYLKAPTSPTSLIKTILTFFILYHNIIPISLISTVELVKVFQAYIINIDPKMRSKTSSNLSVINTSSVIEDLGTINYLFTDKTGTLTCNEMILRVIQVGSRQFYLDDNFVKNLTTGGLQIHDEAFKMFIINLLICNSVVTVDDNDLTYQSSSPDEIAIVNSLNSFGFKFVKRTQQGVLIDYFGTHEFWKILYSIEFTSERKRMSVIAMSPDNQYYMFTKGSDDVVLKRLSPSHAYHFEFTSYHLESFAKLGFRTLCVAYKTMSSPEVGAVLAKFKEATAHLENRRMMHDQVADTVESGLTILGCTGIEDKLQEKVRETIQQLRGANIKIWMMTGDMMETAVNVGFSTELIDDSIKIYMFCFKNKQECLDKLKSIIHQEDIVAHVDQNFHDHVPFRSMAVVLTGQDLQYLLSPEIRQYFLSIALHCKTLICCRISPSQKTDIVRFVRENINNSVTLAIGDGANDCSMIRSAHLGVGIAGKEGLHAVNAADVAIDEFQLLTQLLFVHGAGSYRRICNCIYFVFYKNLILNLLSFFYNFVTLFSGKSIVNKIHFSLFNSFYTAFIPFCFGLADKFTSEEASKNIPILYWNNQKNYQFNVRRFAYWCINATYHSFFIFIICYLGMNLGIFNTYGNPYGIDSFETIILMITNMEPIYIDHYLGWILDVIIVCGDTFQANSDQFHKSTESSRPGLFTLNIAHIDWNESCDVEKVKLDLENVNPKKQNEEKEIL